MTPTEPARTRAPDSVATRRYLVASGVLALGCVALLLWWPARGDEGARTLRRVLTSVVPLVVLGAQLWLVRALWRAPAPRWHVLLLGYAVAAGAALAAPAFHSSDVHAYAQIGRLQTAHDANPYAITPAEVPTAPGDPWFSSTWRDTPCVYGPLFARIAQGTASLAGDDAARARWLFKAWNVLLLLLVAWLAAGCHDDPEQGRRCAALLLSSPLLVLHFVANGHNDLFMAVPLLLAFRLWTTSGWLVACAVLVALAACVKLVAILALPIVLVAEARRGLGWALRSLLAACFVVVALAAPYATPDAFEGMGRIADTLGRPAHTIAGNVLGLVSKATGHGTPMAPGFRTVTRLVGVVLLGLLGGWLLARWRRLARAPSVQRPAALEEATIALAALFLGFSLVFAPWYLGVLLPMACALPEGRPVRRLSWIAGIAWTLAFTPLGRIREGDALLLTLPALLFWAQTTRTARTAG